MFFGCSFECDVLKCCEHLEIGTTKVPTSQHILQLLSKVSQAYKKEGLTEELRAFITFFNWKQILKPRMPQRRLFQCTSTNSHEDVFSPYNMLLMAIGMNKGRITHQVA